MPGPTLPCPRHGASASTPRPTDLNLLFLGDRRLRYPLHISDGSPIAPDPLQWKCADRQVVVVASLPLTHRL